MASYIKQLVSKMTVFFILAISNLILTKPQTFLKFMTDKQLVTRIETNLRSNHALTTSF